MSKNGMRPVHPGEVIREEFMAPLGLSANALAIVVLHRTCERKNYVSTRGWEVHLDRFM